MNVLNVVSKISEKASYPIRSNFCFFFFMYLVGIVVSYAELPAIREDASVYGNLWLELFFDLYIVCILLSLIPKCVRRWVVGAFYIIAYATSIADLFCWVKFQSPLNPSMLLLAAETDKREAGEFFSSYVNSEVLTSSVGLLLLIIVVQCLLAVWNIYRKRKGIKYPLFLSILKDKSAHFIGIIVLVFFVVSAISSFHNKREMVQMFSLKTIGAVEHELTTPDCAVFYTPVYRLIFSLYANHLAAQQIERLVEAKDHATVQSCTFDAKNIVLIIGESMGPHHSQQYGYFMETTPRQVALEKSGLLVPFSDVVAPWNLTSFVFKNVFSMHVVGQKGEWCDYPLFPQLFRKAGYHVSFITNQFLPQAKEAVYDFSGGFFLNHKELSESMFDTRNTRLHTFDEGLLADYDNKLKAENKENNLIIFHLIGSHVSYNQRYPKSRKHFRAKDYEQKRPELTKQRRYMLAHYDNAILYNDSIVDQIVKRFANEEAVVIYMPDHGEECFEGKRDIICRNHSAEIDYDLARYEFAVPFWIYCSPKYIEKHPKVFEQIKAVRDKRFMTDALPHLLLHLAGIKAKDYHKEYDILSPQYNEKRPRILKNQINYDDLVAEHKRKMAMKP
ncbi:phosphoethanolamine transferase [Prevotella falsenii]|uniref:phosphoethanolamine transferase n=1 Tax=Prevotella falsenii TaxID=515414 RepID=UPI00046ACD7D|nr:phosphoethanolamine transferase [Prevotella falsenii]